MTLFQSIISIPLKPSFDLKSFNLQLVHINALTIVHSFLCNKYHSQAFRTIKVQLALFMCSCIFLQPLSLINSQWYNHCQGIIIIHDNLNNNINHKIIFSTLRIFNVPKTQFFYKTHKTMNHSLPFHNYSIPQFLTFSFSIKPI